MATKRLRLTDGLLGALLPLMAACASHVARMPEPSVAPRASHDWIDLQPGWRVRVVVPITRSGSFLPKLEPMQLSGSRTRPASGDSNPPGAITLTASSDLLGYEVSIYSVRGGPGAAMRVVFQSAEVKEGDKITRRPYPTLRLFPIPSNVRMVRILHLTRGDLGNYNAAILASKSLDTLNAFTKQVERRPAECGQSAAVYCSWIPLGVAVIPERR